MSRTERLLRRLEHLDELISEYEASEAKLNGQISDLREEVEMVYDARIDAEIEREEVSAALQDLDNE